MTEEQLDAAARRPRQTMTTMTIDRTPDIDEAMEIVAQYVATFKDDPDGRTSNGAYRLLDNDQQLTRFAIKLAAEMLTDSGQVNGTVSWKKDDQ